MQEKCEIMRYLAELFSGGGYGPINMTYMFLLFISKGVVTLIFNKIICQFYCKKNPREKNMYYN